MKKALILLVLAVFLIGFTKIAYVDEESADGINSQKAIITLIILGTAAVLFFTEALPLPVTAMLVPVALSFPGIDILSSSRAFADFGNKWVVLFMAAFILGEAVFRTGFADKIGQLTVKAAGKSQLKLMLLVMLAIGTMSAFLSNTGTTAAFIPIVMGICVSASLKPGKLLIPMAYAASLGGTLTLIGTPPNGLVNDALEKSGIAPFGFFEFAKIGILIFIVGILYYGTIGHKLLPESKAKAKDFVSDTLKYRTNKMWIATLVFTFVVLMTATGTIPLVTAFMLGACMVVMTGCITMQEAFNSISWTTIFLFAGMLPLGSAMAATGAATMIANTVITYVHSPLALLAAAYVLTALITEVMSNTATAALVMPLGIALADAFDVSAKPILMAIAVAASSCFLTPIATPPNMIILGPGGYSFKDYAKSGWPLEILCAVVAIAVIPRIWPF
ncbi:SLC13 family permease [Methanococcus maripaludis]|uniref:Anion transporter n=1 Tax=Methanococcus maripaludis TaxID=39152 RepID=A0A2L1CAE3_METMI|nr:SLC13 family permease [Methanococcus maripaludis]AVB76342.1 Sodium-dependent dicarboxylate transporter SdcS [Methanococcus maripaludis]MBA2864849.1 anion transporter [Methanococcus maripaludis]MBB6497612.1 anion transporter [Methanococcus maripaludis]